MTESYKLSLTLWPAQPLPESVALELHALGVNLSRFTVEEGQFAARRDREQTIVLDLVFRGNRTMPDLEALLATLRLADISYFAWDIKRGAVTGTSRSFDPASRIERQFTVTADGEPVLTAHELQELEGRYGVPETLIERALDRLRVFIPTGLTEIGPEELVIAIVPEECPEESIEPHRDGNSEESS
jgi:hypothetical protein